MRTSTIRLFSLMLMVIPMVGFAQSNIRSAFDAIIKCPEAKITETHTLDRDQASGKKTGQSDVYKFILPANKENLIKKAVAAFDKDSEMAYSVNAGNPENSDGNITLSVGDGSQDGVQITGKGYEYRYSLYLAPREEDPKGIYRYAYGMNFKEEDGKIIGKLVVTYATTLKYRQDTAKREQQDFKERLMGLKPNKSNDMLDSDEELSQKSWFDMMMYYFQSMSSANSKTRIAIGSKVYKTITESSKYPEVTDADKQAVRGILKGMLDDDRYEEPIIHSLLTQCMTSLK